MRGQAGFFDIDERLKQLAAKGDNLERLSAVVNFELFRADLERAVPRSDGSKGGRPPFDHVLMFMCGRPGVGKSRQVLARAEWSVSMGAFMCPACYRGA